MSFAIASLDVGNGQIGICPIPGRYGRYAADWKNVLAWQPDLVISMTETKELVRVGAATFPKDVTGAGITWRHLPIRDFGAPEGTTLKLWPEVSAEAQMVLKNDGRVLVHCFGGCGRSGMAILRVLVEMGEDGPQALARLRAARSCAIETEAQMLWALRPQKD